MVGDDQVLENDCSTTTGLGEKAGKGGKHKRERKGGYIENKKFADHSPVIGKTLGDDHVPDKPTATSSENR
jgi:hypothetical protein